MGDAIVVHRRVSERHPEIRSEDVAHAWANRIATGTRRHALAGQLVAVGFDARGRMIEMVGIERDDGRVLIFHAMTPPSKKTLVEVHLM